MVAIMHELPNKMLLVSNDADERSLHDSLTTLEGPSKSPIEQHHDHHQQQQQQQRAQRRRHNSRRSNKSKRSVQFNRTVRVVIFERNSDAEADNVWYSVPERKRLKERGHEMASMYRKFGRHEQSAMDFRGYESQTVPRKKHRILTNRSAIYAYHKGLSGDEISALYRTSNWWSSDVAFLQGIHDHISSYNDDGTQDLNELPKVEDMQPPHHSGLIAEILCYLDAIHMSDNCDDCCNDDDNMDIDNDVDDNDSFATENKLLREIIQTKGVKKIVVDNNNLNRSSSHHHRRHYRKSSESSSNHRCGGGGWEEKAASRRMQLHNI